MTSLQDIVGVLLVVLLTAAFAMSAGAQDQTIKLPPLLQQVITGRNAYPLGDKVNIDYGIKNRTSQPIVYNFSSSKKYDIWVTLGGTEVYRLSRGRMYTQAFTSLTIAPGETKTFTVQWDQKDFDGKQVGPGTYTVHAQLAPTKGQPSPTITALQVGNAASMMVTATVADAVSKYVRLSDRDVQITGIYHGTQTTSNDANTKPGPPVGSNDWILCDTTGCMYITGSAEGIMLDPVKDTGKQITVIGRLFKTDQGQVYLKLAAANWGGPKQ